MDEAKGKEFINNRSKKSQEVSSKGIDSENQEFEDQEESSSFAANFQPESAFADLFDQQVTKDRNVPTQAEMIDFL